MCKCVISIRECLYSPGGRSKGKDLFHSQDLNQNLQVRVEYFFLQWGLTRLKRINRDSNAEQISIEKQEKDPSNR